jgi:hypothetical protein
MTMPVADDQVAAMRAYLRGDRELYDQIYGQLDRSAARTGYSALLASAFFEAVDRRFGETGTASDVIDFVADVRSRSEQVGEQIDPRAAEGLIRAALTDGNIDDFDGETLGLLYVVLIPALVSDEQLDDAGLDDFLAQACKLADRWIS